MSEQKSTLSKRKAKRHIQPNKNNKIEVVSSPETKTPVRRGIKFYSFIFVMLILNGLTYSYWLTNIFDDDAPKAPITQAKNLPNPNKKTKSGLPDDFDLPPQNAPVDRGYNASSGQFPPGALPPGVNLPGITSSNPTMQGRTTEQGYGANDGIRQNFTGQQRDTESNLLYYGARYYNPQHGRFTSVDPNNAGATPTDPQSWNGYAYAGNNPLKYNDPTGLWKQVSCATGSESGSCWQWEEGDNWGTLARDSGIGLSYEHSRSLGQFFDGTGLAEGTTVDVSGYNGWLRGLDIGERLSLQSPQFDVDFGVGGVTRNVAKNPGFISRMLNRIFGSGSKSATATFAGGVTREAIERAAADPGGTVRVVTNLTQAPQAGRGLFVAVGEGSQGVAGAARSGGRIFTANIPKALLETLKTAGLAQEKKVIMQATGAQGTEIYFSPEAAEFLIKFFR